MYGVATVNGLVSGHNKAGNLAATCTFIDLFITEQIAYIADMPRKKVPSYRQIIFGYVYSYIYIYTIITKINRLYTMYVV